MFSAWTNHESKFMEAARMKALGVISTTALFLFLGATVPAFAQEANHEEEAKPAKQQEQAKPAKQQEQAKTEKQQEEAKPAKQEEAKAAKQQEQAKTEKQQEEAKPGKQQEQANDHNQKSQGQYAHDGQKDNHGHVYTSSKFGPDHHARFAESGGRLSNGRREYSYGGYWFYAGSYPAWFYQQDVYFIMGADGLWYAVAINDPSLTFVVNIG
jgi:flagellar motor protein MotB